MNRVSRFVIPFFVYAITINAQAGACLATDGSTVVGNIDASSIISKPEDNVAGHTVVFSDVSADVQHKATVCECTAQENPSYSVWDWAQYEVPTESVDGKVYAKVNEYLDVAMSQTFDSIKVDVPYHDKQHKSLTNVCEDSGISGGSASEITARIRKPFVGRVDFNHVLVYSKGTNSTQGEATRTPEIQYYLSGSVVVQQSCEFSPNKVITFDFGNISASSFSQAGAGNKPDGVNVQTQYVFMKCKNIDAGALMSLRLEAEKSSGDAIVSDNEDIGFIIAEGNDRTQFKPNDPTDTHKFQLDDNSAYSFPLSVWPISITGNKPAEGTFTAEGYIRVDFD